MDDQRQQLPSSFSSPSSSWKEDESRTASADAISLDELSLTSFNVAGCQPSAMAPSDWEQQDSIMAMKQEVLVMGIERHRQHQPSGSTASGQTQSQPDILALQELPGVLVHNRGRMDSLFPDYNLVGVRRSHADYVALLIRKGIDYTPVRLVDGSGREILPVVVAELTSCPSPSSDNDQQGGDGDSETSSVSESGSHKCRKIWIASVHLEPFASGSYKRRGQMEILVAKASTAAVGAIFVAGDTNMRVAEDNVMERSASAGGDGSGLGLQDLWKLSGSNIQTKYTWNTRNNISSGGFFNQYYGNDTREYIARYDRIYFKAFTTTENDSSSSHHVKGVKCVANKPITVTQFKLIGNHPIGSSKKHFLSDHFGIYTSFRLTWEAAD
jgi:hypothetical protein